MTNDTELLEHALGMLGVADRDTFEVLMEEKWGSAWDPMGCGCCADYPASTWRDYYLSWPESIRARRKVGPKSSYRFCVVNGDLALNPEWDGSGG